MITEQRVFFEALDISRVVNDFRAGDVAFAYQAGQYLYVGSILPFNNIWFEPESENSTNAAVSVDIWFSQAWVSAVDIIDETSENGASLAVPGRINFRPDINKGWNIEQYSHNVTGLPISSRVYNFYWARFSWDNNLDVATTLTYIGQKFSDDTVLYSFYPDLNNVDMQGSFANGKNNWNEQHYMAAEHIVRDLRKRGIILARGQIVDTALLQDASCHRVAMMVYTAMGTPYFDQLEQAKKDYSAALNIGLFNVDRNGSGDIEPVERVLTTTYVTR